MIFPFRLKLNYCYHLLIGLKVSVSTETKTMFLKFTDTFDLGYQPMVLGHVHTGFGSSTHSHIDWLSLDITIKKRKIVLTETMYLNFFLSN